jgi:hypothetical protein
MTSPLREISNFAAVGWEWSQDYEGFGRYDHQICWIRDSSNLQYGTRIPGGRNWTSTTIDHPGRFCASEVFEPTLKSAREAARAFYEETLVPAETS